ASGAATLSSAFQAAGFTISSASYNLPGSEPGLRRVSVTVSGGSITPAAATQTPVVFLTANVPTGTSLGLKSVLDLVTAQVTAAAPATDGVDVNAYFGTVPGPGPFPPADGTRVDQVAAQDNQNAAQNEFSGFAATGAGQTNFGLVDPGLLANITQHTGVVAPID